MTDPQAGSGAKSVEPVRPCRETHGPQRERLLDLNDSYKRLVLAALKAFVDQKLTTICRL
jgi:hypothetical protein